MEERNVGLIEIAEGSILNWLQFEGGRIVEIRRSGRLGVVIELMIEHPDLPRFRLGDMIPIIRTGYEVKKRGKFTRTVRIEPPRSKNPIS